MEIWSKHNWSLYVSSRPHLIGRFIRDAIKAQQGFITCEDVWVHLVQTFSASPLNIQLSLSFSGLFFFTFNFYNSIVPMGFLPWEIRVAFPGESQLRQSRAGPVGDVDPSCHDFLSGIRSSCTIFLAVLSVMSHLSHISQIVIC